ncbi:transmembrane protein, putative (macronuclear) [Tetrahymena thermophila SB210]|uniref:Transmembrane protein, putative n=1 Tax=Tetrahymena thermophila (strain SB210) TaxID=312017 RepID=W7XJ90_TETTS|nr:transmembrane protein, putative [Tetrahymena thermophila SB210]EWS75311.1 transmembrane protein, putative [Tetrahymena thermophila SB210]|eukprot:XP_012652143.1 transmembrane protein, putative [Tetrahymena thermophila SB210]
MVQIYKSTKFQKRPILLKNIRTFLVKQEKYNFLHIFKYLFHQRLKEFYIKSIIYCCDSQLFKKILCLAFCVRAKPAFQIIVNYIFFENQIVFDRFNELFFLNVLFLKLGFYQFFISLF